MAIKQKTNSCLFRSPQRRQPLLQPAIHVSQPKAEGRSTSTDWSSTAWSQPAPSYPSNSAGAAAPSTASSRFAGGNGANNSNSSSGRQSSTPSAGPSGAAFTRQPDHYDLPVRPNQQGGGGGDGGGGVLGAAAAAQQEQEVNARRDVLLSWCGVLWWRG